MFLTSVMASMMTSRGLRMSTFGVGGLRVVVIRVLRGVGGVCGDSC